MMNLVREGSSAIVGAGSGILATGVLAPVSPQVSNSAIFEGVAFASGVAAQLLAPNTVPAFVDGLVDGSLALLARRGAINALNAINHGTVKPDWAEGDTVEVAPARYGTVHGGGGGGSHGRYEPVGRGNVYTLPNQFVARNV